MVQFASLDEVWGKKEKKKKIPSAYNNKLKPDELKEFIDEAPTVVPEKITRESEPEAETIIVQPRVVEQSEMNIRIRDQGAIDILKKYSEEYRSVMISKALKYIEGGIDYKDIFLVVLGSLVILDIMIRLFKTNAHRRF